MNNKSKLRPCLRLDTESESHIFSREASWSREPDANTSPARASQQPLNTVMAEHNTGGNVYVADEADSQTD